MMVHNTQHTIHIMQSQSMCTVVHFLQSDYLCALLFWLDFPFEWHLCQSNISFMHWFILRILFPRLFRYLIVWMFQTKEQINRMTLTILILYYISNNDLFLSNVLDLWMKWTIFVRIHIKSLGKMSTKQRPERCELKWKDNDFMEITHIIFRNCSNNENNWKVATTNTMRYALNK